MPRTGESRLAPRTVRGASGLRLTLTLLSKTGGRLSSARCHERPRGSSSNKSSKITPTRSDILLPLRSRAFSSPLASRVLVRSSRKDLVRWVTELGLRSGQSARETNWASRTSSTPPGVHTGGDMTAGALPLMVDARCEATVWCSMETDASSPSGAPDEVSLKSCSEAATFRPIPADAGVTEMRSSRVRVGVSADDELLLDDEAAPGDNERRRCRR